jgi:enediyne biosynthesis protein E4
VARHRREVRRESEAALCAAGVHLVNWWWLSKRFGLIDNQREAAVVSVRFLVTMGAGALGLICLLAWWCVGHRVGPEPRRQPEASPFEISLRPQPFHVPNSSRGPSEQEGPSDANSEIRLQEVVDQSGVTFQHDDGSSGRHFTPETMSAGVATLDYDGDGLIDIYFPNGAPLLGTTCPQPPRHALYRNRGQWHFEDVTEQAGVACTAFGLGIAVADYDNDGFPDIYLNNFGPNILYHNNGDGTFTDVTGQAQVAGTTPCGDLNKKVGAGACFLDIDGDGRLDLYSGNYVELDMASYVTPTKRGYAFYPSPLVYTPVPSTLYRNSGDGTFADVSQRSGVASALGRCMGVTACDCDNDGDTDLFVCNDVHENFLFRNKGDGTFDQNGPLAGVSVGVNGEMVANMAVDSADYNHDGWLDFYTTNYDQQHPFLLENLGGGMFDNVTLRANVGRSCYPFVKWGCGFVDFDGDSYKDIFVAIGHTDDNVAFVEPHVTYRSHNVLLQNTGHGRFVDVSAECGIQTIAVHAARGTAFDDLDNDGDVDAVILNSRERPSLLRNMLYEQGSQRHWLAIRLCGVKTNRDGVGAHVRVVSGDLALMDEVHSGRGYQSHWGTRLHFGLGRHERVDRIEVRWLGRGTQVVSNMAADRCVVITEETE